MVANNDDALKKKLRAAKLLRARKLAKKENLSSESSAAATIPQQLTEQHGVKQVVVSSSSNKNNNESENQQLSRKERRRQILSERLDKKLTALERIHANNLKEEEQAEARNRDKQQLLQSENNGEDSAASATRTGGDGSDGENEDDNEHGGGTSKNNSARAIAARRAKLGGTFWKDRKQRKARTLFVGGLPAVLKEKAVQRLMARFGAGEGCDSKLIEVEFLKAKNQQMALARKGGVLPNRNAFIVMPTLEAAKDTANALDGVYLNPEDGSPMTDQEANQWRRTHDRNGPQPSKLRVNGAADKEQRAVAISKRKGH